MIFKMRVRRTLSLIWAIFILAGLFLLYVLTDLSNNLPSIKPAAVQNKWSTLESKLRRIEQEVNQHRAVVGQIREAVNVMLSSHEKPLPPRRSPKISPRIEAEKAFEKAMKVVGDEPPRMMNAKVDMSMCPVRRDTVPKTDIQMLSMYETIMFDDKDGGVWKQGYKIEYKNDLWTSKNKLKVFIVPHSHNDPGWLKTFEDYYNTQTRGIFEHLVEKLFEVQGRKFIWAEVSYLHLWWSEADLQKKQAFKKLLEQGNLEIVTGGWVMNDEANSHWLAIAQQLTLGHQWLFSNLGYRPKNAWSIDPFGHSSSQPYLLKLAAFENSVIQRVHYRVKKELALDRRLEFKWRQLWDGVGNTDMRTHMMPFYSYDVPHTCGPDPKICCQFDFRRLPGNGMTCPWNVPPKPIIPNNVDERASLILDQWRKKAQLYKSNAVLVPLGDDFRYDREIEWDQQYKNYEALIGYINMKETWNTEVQFGTLEDYFTAVHQEIREADMPVLSGDFFTYADRNQHYWSGYYTSRPFYKNMDRVLLAYLRAAETITSQAISLKALKNIVAVQLRDRVDSARKALSLFQHHDGITGTSRDGVKADYGKKLLAAIKHSQSAIQHAAYFLLHEPQIYIQPDADVFFDVDDIWRSHDEIPSRITVTLDEMMTSKRVVFYNALTFKRHEIVTVFVNSPHVEVFNPADEPMVSQITPTVSGENNLHIPNNLFQLSFLVEVEPLSLTAYTISLRDISAINKYTSYSKVRIYNADYWNLDLPTMFAVEKPTATLNEDITVQAGNSTRIVTNMNGLIKTIVKKDGGVVPAHMDFVFYGSQRQSDNNSGAYLFMPDGPARTLKTAPYPEIVITEGHLKATLYVALKGPKTVNIVLSLTVYNNPKFAVDEVEISNSLLIDPLVDDLELAMRFSTSIANGDVFYTDVNGMQMIKRRYFDKLPLQANFYPLPAATYIQDDHTRLTLLTSTPLGMAALSPGQIEIMQDRRLSRDDNRGLHQGVLDNIRTRHTFKMIVESDKPCQQSTPAEHPSGWLSVGAHVSQQSLLQPLIKMYYTPLQEDDANRKDFAPLGLLATSDVDVILANYNPFVTGKTKDGKTLQGAGLTFHRVLLDTCYGTDIKKYYPIGNGQVYLPDITNAFAPDIYESSLTYTHIYENVPRQGLLVLCPMEVKSVFVNISNKREAHVVKT